MTVSNPKGVCSCLSVGYHFNIIWRGWWVNGFLWWSMVVDERGWLVAVDGMEQEVDRAGSLSRLTDGAVVMMVVSRCYVVEEPARPACR